MTLFKKATLATALAASALAATTPAMAHGYYRHGGGDAAAIGIGAGILGLAVGAAIASDHHDRYDRYDRRYYNNDGYYNGDAYYNRRNVQRYDRDEWRRNNDYYRRDDWRRGYDRDDYYRRGY